MVLQQIKQIAPGWLVQVFHILLHVSESIKQSGPPIEHNMFAFEQFIGLITRNINNPRSVVQNGANNFKRLSTIYTHAGRLRQLNTLYGLQIVTTNLDPSFANEPRFHAIESVSSDRHEINISESIQTSLYYFLIQSSRVGKHYFSLYKQYRHNMIGSPMILGLEHWLLNQNLSFNTLEALASPTALLYSHKQAFFKYYEYQSVLSSRNITKTNSAWIFDTVQQKIGQIINIISLQHQNIQYKLLYVNLYQSFIQTPGGMEVQLLIIIFINLLQ